MRIRHAQHGRRKLRCFVLKTQPTAWWQADVYDDMCCAALPTRVWEAPSSKLSDQMMSVRTSSFRASPSNISAGTSLILMCGNPGTDGESGPHPTASIKPTIKLPMCPGESCIVNQLDSFMLGCSSGRDKRIQCTPRGSLTRLSIIGGHVSAVKSSSH